MSSIDDRASRNRRTAWRLSVLVVAMFGFGFALVPLYDVLCEITGLNGKTGRVEAASLVSEVDTSRSVTVEFIATVNRTLHWQVRPQVSRMSVHPGRVYETTYIARNLAREITVGQAVPSVSPGEASIHFNKTECFCFSEQRFEGQEQRAMPVRFVVSTDLPEHVKTVTLSYTFFDAGNSG